ncbi:midnolin-like [Antennarius striatus]|uniref:midnolin-like n=1 Tax=Antennarius striatus TaxID=241820 RepID=UPI0035B330AA
MEQHQQPGSRCGFASGRPACCGAGVSTGPPTMRLSITSTAGSPVELTVPRGETVEGLKTQICQKLRLQTNKIVLLHGEKKMTAGKLSDLGVEDGSSLTLVPVTEAGLLCSSAKAEGNLKDVLESLTEVQISDFLSGRLPLTIKLGIGVHVTVVHLQLSAQNGADTKPCSGREIETGLPPAVGMNCSDCIQTNTARSMASPPLQTATPSVGSDPSSSIPKGSFSSHSSSITPNVTCSSPHPSGPSDSTLTNMASGCPQPSCSLKAATPICSLASTGSTPGPMSPAPASTFRESDVHAPSSAEMYKQPGAVIESFGSQSPGVFSGTFSGTLAPCNQNCSPSAIILQILSDLLRAVFHHQGASLALSPFLCPSADPPVSPSLMAEQQKSEMTKRMEHLSRTPGVERRPVHSSTQEDQALHCKLERLQHLIHQRHLRRLTRRKSHRSQASHPYEQRHHHP